MVDLFDVVPSECLEEMNPAVQPLFDLIVTFIELAFMFGMLLAVGGLTIAGLMYITGGPATVEKARRIAIATIKGVLIILLAPALVALIVTNLNPYC